MTGAVMIATRHPTRTKPTEAPPETAVRALVRTFGLLERVQQPYWARFGISGSQWGVLRAMHRAQIEQPGGLRLTDLSQRLLVRPPSVTGVIDRLQRAGLVVRGASSGDLRTKRVSLTPRGRQLVEQVLAGHRARLHLLLAGLSDSDQAKLYQLLMRWGEHLENLAETENSRRAMPARNTRIE
jgi:DNA-binding MarR family transcriptional regulator